MFELSIPGWVFFAAAVLVPVQAFFGKSPWTIVPSFDECFTFPWLATYAFFYGMLSLGCHAYQWHLLSTLCLWVTILIIPLGLVTGWLLQLLRALPRLN
ncbi:MAG TPA: hypothetical protein VEB18_00520 [Candidatus Paceibacterota bacterium]|nr:hypothetical protein [Candidatus Paceibacterota bacterium]